MPDRSAPDPDAEALRRRNRELAILNSFAEALNRSVDLDQALHTALAQVAGLLGLQTGWIWLLREETGESYLAASQNLPPALANNPERMEGTCYCLDTYRAGDLSGAANINVITCSRLKQLVDGTDGLRYHASIPLYAQRKQLGVLNVASTDWRELSGDDLRILHTVGDLLSMAIERARLYAKSTQLGAAEERNRLARELHDTLAQGLAAIALHLETADVLLETGGDPERTRQAVRQAMSLTRSNLEEARRSVLDLRAEPLEGRTLADALQALAGEWAARGGLALRFEAIGGSRPLPVRVEAGLYRIVHELLANVVHHAGARHVAVYLLTTPDELRCVVEDDGRGFDPAHVPRARYGLVGINERVRLLNGKLKIESDIGAGTRIEVAIPLEQEP